jgi:acyl-CoA thioesterase-1
MGCCGEDIMRHALCILLMLASLPLFAQEKIVVVGDSLSTGYGLALGEGWVDLLQQRLQQSYPQYTLINASISGDTTSQGLARLPDVLSRHQPSILILGLGGNDGLRGLSPQQMQANLQSMLGLAQAQQVQVILLGVRLPPNYGKVYRERFENVYQSLSQQFSVELVPYLLQGVGGSAALMQADGIHPSSAAQPIILETVWSVLHPFLHSPSSAQ